MTMGEIVEAIENISEDSVKKLKIASWLSVELGRIVNRRAYFWRKAAFSLDSVAATPTYNLSDTGTSPLDIAPDFLQFATPLIKRWSDAHSSIFTDKKTRAQYSRRRLRRNASRIWIRTDQEARWPLSNGDPVTNLLL